MSTDVITRNGAVARYDGENWMATYPCGHTFGVHIAGRLEDSDDGLVAGWWKCPEVTCFLSQTDEQAERVIESIDDLAAEMLSQMLTAEAVANRYGLDLDDFQMHTLRTYLRTLSDIQPDLMRYEEMSHDAAEAEYFGPDPLVLLDRWQEALEVLVDGWGFGAEEMSEPMLNFIRHDVEVARSLWLTRAFDVLYYKDDSVPAFARSIWTGMRLDIWRTREGHLHL